MLFRFWRLGGGLRYFKYVFEVFVIRYKFFVVAGFGFRGRRRGVAFSVGDTWCECVLIDCIDVVVVAEFSYID